MHDFYRCAPGYEARAKQVANKACYKLVKDMHYEARVHANVRYIADYEKRSIKKGPARNIFLTRDQYLGKLGTSLPISREFEIPI